MSLTPVVNVPWTDYASSVAAALDACGARTVLAEQDSVLLKPNLVNASPYPVTTHPDFTDAVVQYVKAAGVGTIIIAEGCGAQEHETTALFERHGYEIIANRHGCELVDLNNAELVRMERPGCPIFPEMWLPKIVFEHFLISLPTLKAHSLADVTGAMKNMVGIAPPEYYGGQWGSWRKAAFHQDTHQAVRDLMAYRKPDLSVLDARRGLADYHLGGSEVSPPPERILAGFDSLAVDREAAALLSINWRSVAHLAQDWD